MNLADRAVGALEKKANNTEEQSENLRAIARGQEQLKRAIKQSTEILGTLIKSESLAIIEKMERDRARNAIDDLKAGVTAMKEILGEDNISKELTEQFVTHHLVPLRRYLIKASNILDESEDKNLGRCCRIIGLTALVAGYEYLGQNVDTGLKKELGNELLALQKYMLTGYAFSILTRGEEFEWENVPDMLSPKGAESLAHLFIQSNEKKELTKKKITKKKVPNPNKMSATEAKKAVKRITDMDSLVFFVGTEELGKNRYSVISECQNRQIELETGEEDIE
ncbi:MAG: hypothetical protein HY096_03065 [Nitrospinae bacterium]|nr:hypothetical protein [Nitrospinota bacterium]